MSFSPIATLVGIVIASISFGTLIEEGWAVKAQSSNGSRDAELTCDSCLCTREDGVSAARSIVCFPPQQKPAAPILRLFVANGGGEVRSALMKEKTRGVVIE